VLSQFDWNVTRNEDMADISGLQIAYRAWSSLQEGDAADLRLPGLNLNTRQLFFLNAAQVNVHDELRNRRLTS
jgi:predicted metalloendopeptidase